MALKRIYTVVAVLGIAGIGAAAWWWQNRAAPTGSSAGAPPVTAAPNAPAAPPKPGGGAGGGGGPVAVEVGKVSAVTLTDDVQAVGTMRSRQGVVLRPEISGRVAKLGFRDGQRVRRGQLLVQLDDTLLQAQLQQAQAQQSIARTNLQRSRELLAQSFVSQSAVDQNAAALQVAQAQVALAQAQLARTQVLAPFDGMVGIRQVNVGDYLKDGAEIVNIEDLSSMAVDFRLPERYLAQLRLGQSVEVALDALPGQRVTGQVEALDVQVDANGRAILVRAKVENVGGRLRPGMFARPRLLFGVRQGALVVPEEALVPLGERQYLFKLADGGNGQMLARRIEAKLGMRRPGMVEIVEGLNAGDSVVTAGHTRLRGESTPVRVIDLANPGGAPGKARPREGGKAASGAAPA